MSKVKIAEKVLKENGGVATISDMIKSGVSHREVSRLCEKGDIIRLKRGYFISSSNIPFYEKIVSKLVPEAVISVESALFHYGYSDFVPRKLSITVPRSTSIRKLEIDYVSIKAYYVEKKYYDIGKETKIINDTLINIYDRERTICDCFKYRNKIDSELFNKAMKAYSEDMEKNVKNLLTYAKQLNVYYKLKEYMGVIING